MAYGISVFNGTYDNINPQAVGGAIFVQRIFISSATNSVYYDFPNIPNASNIKLYYVVAGVHSADITNLTVGVRITFTATASTNRRDTDVLIFTTGVTEPAYGIVTFNSNGEKLISTTYPIPKFLGKVTVGSTYTSSDVYGSNYRRYIHTGTTSSLGAGTDRLILWALPNQSGDVWFSGRSFVDSSVTGSYDLYPQFLVPTTGATYTLPEAFIFSLSGYSASSDTYGLRLYGSTGNLLFDSGNKHLYIKEVADSNYTEAGFSMPLSYTNPAVLIPAFTRLHAVNFRVNTYGGFVKRQNSIFYSKLMLSSSYVDDSVPYTYINYGRPDNVCFFADAIDLGSTGGGSSTPLTGYVTSSNVTSFCNYTNSVYGANEWVAEYSTELSSADITLATNIAVTYFTQNNYIGVYGGQARYGLYRKPDAEGLKFWTTFSRDALGGDYGATFAGYFYNIMGTTSVDYQRSITTSKTYDPGTGNGDFYDRPACTTSETLTVTIAGGNANPKTYAWSFFNNAGGFGFTTGTTGTSVTVSKKTSQGTYTCTVRCTVTQTGSDTLVIDTPISHTHSITGGNVVSPIPSTSNTWTDSVIYAGWQETVTCYLEIVVRNDGLVYLQSSNYPDAATSALWSWWWSGSSGGPGTGVNGIGNAYYVKFTLTSQTTVNGGGFGYYDSTTGWQQLSADRKFQVFAYADGNPASYFKQNATYTIQIATDAAGTNIVSTTTGVTLSARAENTWDGGPPL